MPGDDTDDSSVAAEQALHRALRELRAAQEAFAATYQQRADTRAREHAARRADVARAQAQRWERLARDLDD